MRVHFKLLILAGTIVSFVSANRAADRVVDRIHILEVEKYCLQNLRSWQAQYSITPSDKSCVAKTGDMGGRVMSVWIGDRETLHVIKTKHALGLVALFENYPIVEARLFKAGLEHELKLEP